MASIQEQVRVARDSKGLTQADLGSRIGQPQSAVSRIERGGDLRVSTLLEMARVLEMEPILIPKHLVPAVLALVGQAVVRNQVTASEANIPLVGGAPEDAEDDE
jgi:HTH-type transcriptional regulator / antitoxin HipB